MAELVDLCQAVMDLEQSEDKKGLDNAIADLTAFLKTIDHS